MKILKKTQQISAREFSDGFTEIVSRHLARLPPKEQDRRIKNAERAATRVSRAERPITHRVEEIRPNPLRCRIHE